MTEAIVAIDVSTSTEALDIAGSVVPDISTLKIGLNLFCSLGPSVVESLKALGAGIFLDLKLYDIPFQVERTAESVSELGVAMLTVHAMGGEEMMSAAKRGAERGAERAGHKPPAVIGVTVLTSMDDNSLESIGILSSAADEVSRLAALADSAGLDGVVASVHEIEPVRAAIGRGLMIVTPGIRPAWAQEADDQRRTATPLEAARLGADFVVIGRPITFDPDPRAAARRCLAELGG